MYKRTIRFVSELSKPDDAQPIQIRTSVVNLNDEVEIAAVKPNGAKLSLLGIRSDGTVVRYTTSRQQLEAFGFKVSDKRPAIRDYDEAPQQASVISAMTGGSIGQASAQKKGC